MLRPTTTPLSTTTPSLPSQPPERAPARPPRRGKSSHRRRVPQSQTPRCRATTRGGRSTAGLRAGARVSMRFLGMPSCNAPRYDSQTLRSPTVFSLARSTSGGSRTAALGRTGGGGGGCRADVGGVARRLGRLGAGAAGGLNAGCCCKSCSGVGLLEGGERRRGAAAFVARVRCGPALQHLAHELLTANMA
jgi:hypothetical protein